MAAEYARNSVAAARSAKTPSTAQAAARRRPLAMSPPMTPGAIPREGCDRRGCEQHGTGKPQRGHPDVCLPPARGPLAQHQVGQRAGEEQSVLERCVRVRTNQRQHQRGGNEPEENELRGMARKEDLRGRGRPCAAPLAQRRDPQDHRQGDDPHDEHGGEREDRRLHPEGEKAGDDSEPVTDEHAGREQESDRRRAENGAQHKTRDPTAEVPGDEDCGQAGGDDECRNHAPEYYPPASPRR